MGDEDDEPFGFDAIGASKKPKKKTAEELLAEKTKA